MFDFFSNFLHRKIVIHPSADEYLQLQIFKVN